MSRRIGHTRGPGLITEPRAAPENDNVKHVELRGTLKEALCELLRAWSPSRWYQRVLKALLLRELECGE